jgi:hypothetical protein
MRPIRSAIWASVMMSGGHKLTLSPRDRVMTPCASGWDQGEHWDRAFHRNLPAATHKIKQGHTNAAFWKGYQDERRKIASALAARDALAVAEAIRDHLTKVRIKMLGA